MKVRKTKDIEKMESAAVKERKGKIFKICASLGIALILWIAMVFVANSILQESAHVNVYRARADIPKGTKITEDNLDDILEVVNISEDYVPNGAIEDRAVLVDVFTNREYAGRDIITTAGISTVESMTAHIENPIEISVATTSMDAAVGGILREGDYINIYTVRNRTETSMARLIISNAYVTKALDQSGREVARSDASTTATVVNLIIPMEVEKQFNEALMAGTVRMSLIYNPDISNMKALSDWRYGEDIIEVDGSEANGANGEEFVPYTDGTEDAEGQSEDGNTSEGEDEEASDNNNSENETGNDVEEDDGNNEADRGNNSDSDTGNKGEEGDGE